MGTVINGPVNMMETISERFQRPFTAARRSKRSPRGYLMHSGMPHRKDMGLDLPFHIACSVRANLSTSLWLRLPCPAVTDDIGPLSWHVCFLLTRLYMNCPAPFLPEILPGRSSSCQTSRNVCDRCHQYLSAALVNRSSCVVACAS